MLIIESFDLGHSGDPMTEQTCLYNGTSRGFTCEGWKLVYIDIETNRILHTHIFSKLHGSFDPGEHMLLFSGKGHSDFFHQGEDSFFRSPHWKIFLNRFNPIINTASWEVILYENDKILISLRHEADAKKDMKKVFIVHGRDKDAKKNVTDFITELGFEPIILDEQASGGQTIIQKLETYSNVGFGVVLYTPCDVGMKEGDEKLLPRARQNVVFEHGYLIAKLGRENVVAIVKGEIEKPSDISGIAYIHYKRNWRNDLVKEMKDAGYAVDMNKVMKLLRDVEPD